MEEGPTKEETELLGFGMIEVFKGLVRPDQWGERIGLERTAKVDGASTRTRNPEGTRRIVSTPQETISSPRGVSQAPQCAKSPTSRGSPSRSFITISGANTISMSPCESEWPTISSGDSRKFCPASPAARRGRRIEADLRLLQGQYVAASTSGLGPARVAERP